jgi:hypothetical protein
MNADVEAFLEECRRDPFFRNDSKAIDHIEEIFEEYYLAGDDNPAWQDIWDRIRKIATQKDKPLMEQFEALVPILREIADRLD